MDCDLCNAINTSRYQWDCEVFADFNNNKVCGPKGLTQVDLVAVQRGEVNFPGNLDIERSAYCTEDKVSEDEGEIQGGCTQLPGVAPGLQEDPRLQPTMPCFSINLPLQTRNVVGTNILSKSVKMTRGGRTSGAATGSSRNNQSNSNKPKWGKVRILKKSSLNSDHCCAETTCVLLAEDRLADVSCELEEQKGYVPRIWASKKKSTKSKTNKKKDKADEGTPEKQSSNEGGDASS
jgi:hypothetical protein